MRKAYRNVLVQSSEDDSLAVHAGTVTQSLHVIQGVRERIGVRGTRGTMMVEYMGVDGDGDEVGDVHRDTDNDADGDGDSRSDLDKHGYGHNQQ